MRTLHSSGRWLPLLVASVACSAHQDASTRSTSPEAEAATAVAPGQITGFGVDGQPRQWGSDGRAVKPALDMIVNDLGADFFRVEVNNGETDWETTNDDADPKNFNWAVYDKIFSGPVFQDLWDYVRYLNQLGVPEIELADHGGLPAWMGPSGSTDPASSLDSSKEDEWVETSVAMLEYALTRSPLPHPQFTLFSPFNEPEFSPPEGFKIDPGTQGARIIRKLVDRMNALPDLNGIKIVVSDSASEPGMITFRQAIQNDTVVQARLAATAFHRYSDASTWSTWNNSNPPVWLTEFNSTWQASCYSTTWTMGLQAVGNLVSALQNGVTAGLAWSDYDAPHIHQANEWQTFGLLATVSGGKSESQLCGYFNNTQPADSVLDAMTYTPKATYRALRHGFKWIRRGATRVTASDNSSSVDLVAYKNPDGSVAVFGRNTGGAASVKVTLTMSSPPASLTPRTTTASTTDQVGAAVSLANGVGTFSLPAQSVFTLLSNATGGGSGGTGGTTATGGTGGTTATGGTSTTGGTGSTSATGGAGGTTATGGTSTTGGTGGSSGRATGGTGGTSARGGSSGKAGSAGRAGSSGASGMSSTGGTGTGGTGTGGTSTTGGTGGTGGSSGSAGSAGMSSGLPPLIAGWAFNEGSGSTTADASGHGHTGTLVNSPSWLTSGCKYGGCLSFSGTGRRVTTPDANDLDLNQNFTIMAWVQPSTASGWRPVLIKEEPAGLVYLLYAATESGWLDIGGQDLDVTATGSLSTSVFSHVAFERNGNVMTYWLNGTQIASRTISGNTTASTGLLAIGGHSFWGGEWFSGKIDDVRIYASSLSSAQIQQAMSAGL